MKIQAESCDKHFRLDEDEKLDEGLHVILKKIKNKKYEA